MRTKAASGLSSPSAVTARLACVRGFTLASPAQASRQTSQQQFHWGKPPPAAAPSTKADKRLMRRLSRQPTDLASETDVRSELGRQVAVDLEADADFDESRGRPSHVFLHECPLLGKETMHSHLGSSGLACK